MMNRNGISLVDELTNHWGFRPCRRCYCGCGGEPTTGHFLSGHDTFFAANLLAALRGNQDVERAIRGFIE